MQPENNQPQSPATPPGHAREGESLTPSTPPPGIKTHWIIITMLAGFLLLGLLVFLLRPSPRIEVIRVIEGPETRHYDVNLGETIDAISDTRAAAKTGYRYRVKIEDETDDRSAGIARIGGLVTFVANARRGQILHIELTSVRSRVAHGTILHIEQEAAQPQPPSPAIAKTPPRETVTDEIIDATDSSAEHVVPGALFRLRMTESSRRNPDNEAVGRIGGLVTFVPGTRIGDEAIVRIVDRRERMAFARLVNIEKRAPDDTAPPQDIADGLIHPADEASADDVIVGRRFEVVINEPSRIHPETEGVTHINGLVVVVAGAREGERHVIRITERRARMAFAEIAPPPGD